MHQQLVVLLLVGLAASAYGLDLSHAAKRSTELEPRLLNLIGDLYAQVIYPPLNHVVTNLALLSAQILAGIAQTGLPAPGGRSLQPSEAELRGFFGGLWNEAIKPPIENALSGVALLAAQLLAGVGMNGVNLGIGKRDLTEAEMRGINDVLTQALNNVFTNVIQKPVEDALSTGALLLAQILAGAGTNGINLSNLLGKRDLNADEARAFGDALTQALNNVFTNVIQKPVEDALSTGALLLAQILAGAGTNGINLSNLLGKRDLNADEARAFGDALTQALNNVFTNVIQKPVEDALSTGALLLAQILAGAGTNGINLSNLLGKRDLGDFADHEAELRGIFTTVGGNILNGLQGVWNGVFQVPLENFVQNGALSLAQILANLGTNGVNLGKRAAETRGPIINNLVDHASGLFTNQVKPILENGLNAAALHLAGVLANFSQNLGRR